MLDIYGRIDLIEIFTLCRQAAVLVVLVTGCLVLTAARPQQSEDYDAYDEDYYGDFTVSNPPSAQTCKRCLTRGMECTVLAYKQGSSVFQEFFQTKVWWVESSEDYNLFKNCQTSFTCLLLFGVNKASL